MALKTTFSVPLSLARSRFRGSRIFRGSLVRGLCFVRFVAPDSGLARAGRIGVLSRFAVRRTESERAGRLGREPADVVPKV